MTFDGELVLHGSTTSPFVRKVRVALIEKGLAHRFQLAPPWSPTAGVEKLNPLHKVPVLVLADGMRLFDSRVIIQYLDLRQPVPALLPDDRAQRIEALRIEALADGVSEAVALHTQEQWRQPAARSGYWSARQRQKVLAGIAALEAGIEPWLPVSGPLSLVAIATGAALGSTAFWLPEVVWQAEAPRLAALYERLEGYVSWQETRPFLVAGATFPVL